MKLSELISDLSKATDLTATFGFINNYEPQLQIENNLHQPIMQFNPVACDELNRLYVDYQALTAHIQPEYYLHTRAKKFLELIAEYLRTPLSDRDINHYWVARLQPVTGNIPGDVCKILDIGFSHDGAIPEWSLVSLVLPDDKEPALCRVITDDQLKLCQQHLPQTVTMTTAAGQNNQLEKVFLDQAVCNIIYNRVGDFVDAR